MRRRICFVTGSRAEFGLMETTLRAIAAHPALELQIVATGMHLSRAHGYSVRAIRRAGWRVDGTVAWDERATSAGAVAGQMGRATLGLARLFDRLETDIVLVVGDRVEPFAAAAAGHVSQRIVAHVHGGDRAQGQVDDALRHAISKLSHLHFAATRESADRLIRMGEHRTCVHCVGTPGVDQITRIAAPWSEVLSIAPALDPRRYAVVVQHPIQPDESVEYDTARAIATALRRAKVDRAIFIQSNNDPGWRGIAQCWREVCDGTRWQLLADAPRAVYLGLLRRAGCLIGNSSSGVLEAASFRTWVINVGQRQQGRQKSANQLDVEPRTSAILSAIHRVWPGDAARAYRGGSVYGKSGAGGRIARILADVTHLDSLRRKLIAY